MKYNEDCGLIFVSKNIYVILLPWTQFWVAIPSLEDYHLTLQS